MERLRATEDTLPDNEAEDAALREELKAREQEVSDLREEVARLKDQSVSGAGQFAVGRIATPPPFVVVCCHASMCIHPSFTVPRNCRIQQRSIAFALVVISRPGHCRAL